MKRVAPYKRARAAERKVERRDASFDAAERQIVRAAYRDINMLDIARRLHLAKGTLYLYFPTKYERFFGRVEEALAERRCDTTRARRLLGFSPRPVADSVRDTADSLVAQAVVN